jgi:hypothetical protein
MWGKGLLTIVHDAGGTDYLIAAWNQIEVVNQIGAMAQIVFNFDGGLVTQAAPPFVLE